MGFHHNSFARLLCYEFVEGKEPGYTGPRGAHDGGIGHVTWVQVLVGLTSGDTVYWEEATAFSFSMCVAWPAFIRIWSLGLVGEDFRMTVTP
jgi:hypothetical protein